MLQREFRMRKSVDVSSLKRMTNIFGDCPEDTRKLRPMAEEARSYLLSHSSCKKVRRGWFGFGVGGVCAVFLFELVPATKRIDSKLWVIVGDLPPAYLVVDESPNPLAALANYVGLMQEWVDTVRAGKPIDDCIPVNAKPTKVNADLLARRLRFMRTNFLS